MSGAEQRPQPARHVVAREVKASASAVIVGAAVLVVLLVAADQMLARSDELENAYHRRAIAAADKLNSTLPLLRLPPGYELVSDTTRLVDPIAFEAAAERALGAARTLSDELRELHKRYDGAKAYAPASARLSRAVESLQELREHHGGDRAGFARAIAAGPTYLEVVALQVRRQHEAGLAALLARRHLIVLVLEVLGGLVLAAVVIGTRRYVRRSLGAIDEILAFDAQRSVELAQSLEARSAALREKETLLKEVYHRVKNNLQVVSSLLNMQGRDMTDPAALRLLNESANRVRAMALVHEQLYRSEDLGKISCARFLRELSARLTEAYGPAPQSPRLAIRTDDLELSLDQAIPVALIVNELVTNAFMHAYQPGASGTILLTLERTADKRARLEVRDDGCGLPAGFSAETTPTLGMRIVVTLARQLGGELTCAREAGTRCELIFDPQRA